MSDEALNEKFERVFLPNVARRDLDIGDRIVSKHLDVPGDDYEFGVLRVALNLPTTEHTVIAATWDNERPSTILVLFEDEWCDLAGNKLTRFEAQSVMTDFRLLATPITAKTEVTA